jgi:predicted Zn-dependent protease
MVNMIILLVILFTSFCSCDYVENAVSGKEDKKVVNYSYDCLDSTVSGEGFNKIVRKGGDILRDIAVDEKTITDDVQNQYGEEFHKDVLETGTFKLLENAQITAHLDQTLKDLLAARENPSKIKYFIYAVDDTAINAFTFGGRIYVTKKMYEACKGKTALLYAIIGHEIGHSEMGHIKRTIQNMNVSEKIFGKENGATAFYLTKLLTASFNQKNELEADYYGTDLTYNLGHDICAAVHFWSEMSGKENQYSRMEDFFRSHPFSNLRAKCLMNHIKVNFGKACGQH